jgi:hypothetical protein
MALADVEPDAVADAEAEPDALPDAEAEPLALGEPLVEAETEALEAEEEALGEGDGATEAGGVVLGAEAPSDFPPKSAPKMALTPQIMSAITRTAAMSATQRRRAYTSGLTGPVGLKGTSPA